MHLHWIHETFALKAEYRKHPWQRLYKFYASRVRQLAYAGYDFYWRTHDFGYAYVAKYAHFLSGSYNSILFKNLQLYIWLLIYCLSLEKTNLLLFTFALKKRHFPIFHVNYLLNIYPYLRGLAILGCQ